MNSIHMEYCSLNSIKNSFSPCPISYLTTNMFVSEHMELEVKNELFEQFYLQVGVLQKCSLETPGNHIYCNRSMDRILFKNDQ